MAKKTLVFEEEDVETTVTQSETPEKTGKKSSKNKVVAEDEPEEAATAEPSAVAETGTTRLPIEDITEKYQPRKQFDPVAMQELEDSIKSAGDILEPLVVLNTKQGVVLLAGHRRLRAAKNLGMDSVPVSFYMGKENPKTIALMENVLREDLSVVETAEAITELQKDRKWKLKDVAEHLGITIARASQLVNLAEDSDKIKDAVRSGDISEADARALRHTSEDKLDAAIDRTKRGKSSGNGGTSRRGTTTEEREETVLPEEAINWLRTSVKYLTQVSTFFEKLETSKKIQKFFGAEGVGDLTDYAIEAGDKLREIKTVLKEIQAAE